MTTAVELRPMQPADYDAVIELWQRSEGVGLGASDTREGIESYLAHNPGFSQVAVSVGRVVGAMLCGHDGRRGYIYHLAVDSHWRGQGIGRRLIDAGLDLLRAQGITKAYIMVFGRNEAGRGFWETVGWEARGDLIPMNISLL